MHPSTLIHPNQEPDPTDSLVEQPPVGAQLETARRSWSPRVAFMKQTITIVVLWLSQTLLISPASADPVVLNPTGGGAPGGGFVQQVINWAGQYALWSGLAAFVVGAGWWAWSRANSMSSGQHKGQMLLIGGAVAAIGVGLAPSIINMLTTAATNG